jgi:transcriptional regulator with XRE-family HTH domain
MDIYSGDARSVNIGDRLKELRIERDHSIRQLANKCGISANALSNIERSQTSPNVSTLYKLAKALNISVTEFFEKKQDGMSIVYQKETQRTRLSFPRGLWEGLGGELFSGYVEPFILTLESGGSSGPYTMEHSGDEFVLCLRGIIEYQVDEEVYHLKAGDSLLFRANLAHRWKNIGNNVGNILIVLSGYSEMEDPLNPHIAS